MNSEEYQQIKRIFQTAVDLEPQKRSAFLDNTCRDNPELRRHLEKLLNSHADDFLEEPAVKVFAKKIIADQLNEGQVIGHYKIARALGTGGMGVVYLAEDSRLNRQVALKILPRHLAEDKERMSRFNRESKFFSALNHPNIVTIFEVGDYKGTHFIVTEFIEGKTLGEHLKGEKSSLQFALKTSIQIVSAMESAHNVGIVHRDIKPDNIMIRPDGIVKVLDFGVAKLVEKQGGSVGASLEVSSATNPGMIIGTANYMSPEQARGNEIDERSDIWSFGVVLQEILSGKRLFDGETKADVVAAILQFKPDSFDKTLSGVPQVIERILHKTLKKDVENRYQTANELLMDLREAKQELEFHRKIEESITPEKKKPGTQIIKATTVGGQHQASTNGEFDDNITLKKSNVRKVLIGTLAVLAIGLGYSFYLGGNQNQIDSIAVPSLEYAKFSRVTSSGTATSASISPDGRYIVHTMDEGGKQSLWVRQTLTGDKTQIVAPSEVDYWGTSFSKDGKYIYYVARLVGKASASLYRVPSIGGLPGQLVSDVDSSVTISPDGTQVAFVRWNPSENHSGLWVANVDGSSERKIATRRFPETHIGGPAWSPDGRTLACPGQGVESGVFFTTILGIRVSDGEQQELTSKRWGRVGRLAWFDNNGLVFNARESNSDTTMQLWYLSYADGKAKPITRDLNNYIDVSLTEDSTALVTVKSELQSNVFLTQTGDETQSIQLTTSKRADGMNISWIPDGRILYDSLASGNQDIWVMKADGTNRKRLTSDPHFDDSAYATSDGRFIIFSSNRSGAARIWRMNVDGSNPIQLTSGNAYERLPVVTPDGQWVVYEGWGSSPGFWKISVDGGKPEPIVKEDDEAFSAVIAPNGKYIAYWFWTSQQQQDDRRFLIGISPFSGGPRVKTFEVAPTSDFRVKTQFSADGQSILYVDTRNGVSNIWSQPIHGGLTKQITKFKANRIFGFAYSPDGKQLALTKGESTSDVVLISGINQ